MGHRGGGLYFGSPTPPENYSNYRMGAGDFYNMNDPQARLFAHSQKQWGGEIPRLADRSQQQQGGWWESLSRIFTFGCVETSHNK